MSEDEARGPKPQESGFTARQEYWLRLYQQYHQEVRRYLARHVRGSQDVDDLMQMVFLNVIAHEGNLHNPHAYLRAVARHQLSFYWRWRKRSRLIGRVLLGGPENSADGMVFCDCDSDPLHQLSRQEMHRAISAMIGGLSPVLSEALRLRYVDGLQPGTAAIKAGCSRAALKKRLERAKRLLLECFHAGGSWLGK